MDSVSRFFSWLWFRKFVIGVVIGAILCTFLIVGYKDQNDENVRQNERLEQVVADLTLVVAQQEELRVANDKASCISGNNTREAISETFRNVIDAILIAGGDDPESASSRVYTDAVEEQLGKLVPRDCEAADDGVPGPVPPAIPQ